MHSLNNVIQLLSRLDSSDIAHKYTSYKTTFELIIMKVR